MAPNDPSFHFSGPTNTNLPSTQTALRARFDATAAAVAAMEALDAAAFHFFAPPPAAATALSKIPTGANPNYDALPFSLPATSSDESIIVHQPPRHRQQEQPHPARYQHQEYPHHRQEQQPHPAQNQHQAHPHQEQPQQPQPAQRRRKKRPTLTLNHALTLSGTLSNLDLPLPLPPPHPLSGNDSTTILMALAEGADVEVHMGVVVYGRANMIRWPGERARQNQGQDGGEGEGQNQAAEGGLQTGGDSGRKRKHKERDEDADDEDEEEGKDRMMKRVAHGMSARLERDVRAA